MDILATARQVWQNYFKTGASSYMVASLNLKEWPVADESDVLFQEIEDDLRQEQTNKLWTDYGKYIVGAALALVIGVAGFQGWKNYDLEKRQVAGETFASVWPEQSAPITKSQKMKTSTLTIRIWLSL